jgi:hypothetical protein
MSAANIRHCPRGAAKKPLAASTSACAGLSFEIKRRLDSVRVP